MDLHSSCGSIIIMKLIDLSILVENTPSEPMEIKVKRLEHVKGGKQFCRRIRWNKKLPLRRRLQHYWQYSVGKRRITIENFPDNAFLSLDIVTMPTHMGTHIDAPFHYGPRKDRLAASTVDQLPLEWFYRPAVKLDLTHKKAGEYITVADLQEALSKINYLLQPFDIVLIATGADKLWGTPHYFSKFPGMSREATQWLVSQGIKVIGTDTYGFDRPFSVMLNDFWDTKDERHLWPAHFYGREKEYIQIERLINLDQLPAVGFKLACFPLRLKGVDASWVRAVAIFDN